MEILYKYVPLVLLIIMIVYPFGYLTNESYKAVKNTNTVPSGTAVTNYIPFINYAMLWKYFHGSPVVGFVGSGMALLLLGFRFGVYLSQSGMGEVAEADLEGVAFMGLISVWAAIAGLAIWYLTMGITAFEVARLTRGKFLTKLFCFLIPPLGAYITAKNVRKYFAERRKEGHDEFSGVSDPA